MNIESIVKPEHRRIIVKAANNFISPHSMAKRIDKAIIDWRRYWTGIATGATLMKLPDFIKPRPIETFKEISHIKYLPGRAPVNLEVNENFRGLFSTECEMLNKQRIMPKKLNYLVFAGADTVFAEAKDYHLPFLAAQMGLSSILREALEQDVNPLFGIKTIVRIAVIEKLEMIRNRINSSDSPLEKAFEIAMLGNALGFSQSIELYHNFLNLNVDKFVKSSKNCFADDSRKILKRLEGKNLAIAYFTDNTGESIYDLLLIEQLIKQGHMVTLVTRSKPALNDEVFFELEFILRKNLFALPGLKHIPGWDICGINFLSTPPEVAKTLSSTDLVISKGEGNFQGMPPDHEYSFDIAYLITIKTPMLPHRLTPGGVEPGKGQDIIFFKPAGFKLSSF